MWHKSANLPHSAVRVVAMRADAIRNLDSVLQTGARLLAQDPSTSMATIAAKAGVDRRTLYRQFATRETLLAAVFRTKLDAADQVFADARLKDAPVAVALHRYVEGIVPVIRRWPVDPERVRCETEAYGRMLDQRERFGAFVRRAVEEGVFRADLPEGLARGLLLRMIDLVSTRFPDIEPAPAADVIVDALLCGIGQP
jgi:AcrR family transcriptional regulator